MGFYFDGSGQRTHRHEPDDLEHEDIAPLRPSPGKSSRTHGGSDVLGIPGKISLTARLAQRIDRYARTGHHATPDEHARDAVAQALGSTGQLLPDAVRHSLEEHAGTSLGDVRIHTGPESARAAEALGAEAFTVGQEIHFAAGAYDPESAPGRRLLAHEVAHAIQQRGQPRVALDQADISEPDQAHERQADEFAGLLRVDTVPRESDAALPATMHEASAPSPAMPSPSSAAVQMDGAPSSDDKAVREIAARGVAGSKGPLPYLETLRRLFGPLHDLDSIRVRQGGAAADAASTIGAHAYAFGDVIAFDGTPSLHRTVHEVTHVLQQRTGIRVDGGVGRPGDAYERQADAVAHRAVAGEFIGHMVPAAAKRRGSVSPTVQRDPKDLRATWSHDVVWKGDRFRIEVNQTTKRVGQRVVGGTWIEIKISYIGSEEPDRKSWSWLDDGGERKISPRYVAGNSSTYPNGWSYYPATIDLYGDGSVILDVGDTASPNNNWEPPARNHEMYAGKDAARRSRATRTIMVKSKTAVPAGKRPGQKPGASTSPGQMGGADKPKVTDLPATATVEIAIARVNRFATDKGLGVIERAPWSILLRQLRSDLAALRSRQTSGKPSPEDETIRARAASLLDVAGDAQTYFIALAAMSRPEAYPADIAAEALAMIEPVIQAWATATFASYRNEPDKVAAFVKPAERQFLALPHRLNGLYLKPGKALDTMVNKGGALRLDLERLRAANGAGRLRGRPIEEFVGLHTRRGDYADVLDRRIKNARTAYRQGDPNVAQSVLAVTDDTLLINGAMSLLVMYEQFVLFEDKLTGLVGTVVDAVATSTNRKATLWRQRLDNWIGEIDAIMKSPAQDRNGAIRAVLGKFQSSVGGKDFEADVKQIQGRLKTIQVIDVIDKALVVIGLAAFTAGAAGAAAGAALSSMGFSATAVGVGTFAAEVTAFTFAERLGNQVVFGGNQTSLSENLATNAVMFGFLKSAAALHGRIFKLIADPKKYKVLHGASQMGTSFAALQAFAEGHHYYKEGRMMNADERTVSLVQNVTILAFLHLGRFVAQPLEKRIGDAVYQKAMQSPTIGRVRVANLQRRSQALARKIAALRNNSRADSGKHADLIKDLQALWDGELQLLDAVAKAKLVSESDIAAAQGRYSRHLAELELQLSQFGLDVTFGKSQSFRPVRDGVIAFEDSQLPVLKDYYKENKGTLEKLGDGLYEGRIGSKTVQYIAESRAAANRARQEAEAKIAELKKQLDDHGKRELADLLAKRSSEEVWKLLEAQNDPKKFLDGRGKSKHEAAAKQAASEARFNAAHEMLKKSGFLERPLVKADIAAKDQIALRGRIAEHLAELQTKEAFAGDKDVRVLEDVDVSEQFGSFTNRKDAEKAVPPGKTYPLYELGGKVWRRLTNLDVLAVRDGKGKKSTVERFVEVKSGKQDTPAKAKEQQQPAIDAFARIAAGDQTVRLHEHRKIDITNTIDAGTAGADKAKTAGPSGKKFELDLGVTQKQLDDLAKKIIKEAHGQ